MSTAAVKRTQSTVKGGEIQSIVQDPQRGIVSLVGDHGGLSLITGEVQQSSVVPGAVMIETEHGTVYLDPDEDHLVSEEFPIEALDPLAPSQDELQVSWTIDEEGPGLTPVDAAWKVWRDVFGRTVAAADDACCFVVTEPSTGRSVQLDLSDHPEPEKA